MMSTEQGAKLAVETVGERQIHIARVFPAPRERVFATYMDPELIPEWRGRRSDKTTVEPMEPRTGGDWRYRCESPEGTIVFPGTFREVTPPERVVETFEWNGMPGYVSVDATEFEDLGDGRTKVVTTSALSHGFEPDGIISAGMEKGLGEAYGRLEELLGG